MKRFLQTYSMALVTTAAMSLLLTCIAAVAQEQTSRGDDPDKAPAANQKRLAQTEAESRIELLERPAAIPNKDTRKDRQRERDEKALLRAPNNASQKRHLERAQFEAVMQQLQHQQAELQRHQQKLAEERDKMAAEIARANAELQRMRQQPERLERQRATLDAELEAVRAKLKQLSTAQLRSRASANEEASLRTFHLKYAKPDQIGQALRELSAGNPPRIVVDERMNAVLVVGNDHQITVADQLVSTLDQAGKEQKDDAAETLQLRIVWLLHGVADGVGEAPKSTVVHSTVIDALAELGFTNPRVVCQQLSTLTLAGKNSSSGKFHFEVPVLITEKAWQFQAQGLVSRATNDQYRIEFQTSVRERNVQGGQLSGSIYTPLARYTIMGTTTFVTKTADQPAEGPSRQEQHLSAFVVYLDRVREFSANEAKPAKEKGR